MIVVFAEVAQIIQLEWQGLAAFGTLLAGGIATAGRFVASQLKENAAGVERRHQENRDDAVEARDENRVLNQAILAIQGKTVETLTGLQREIEHVVARLDRIEGAGPKPRAPLPQKS